MANLFTATQRPEVVAATPPATKILDARDQTRHRGPDFEKQLENVKRDRPESAARDRRNAAPEPERHERRDSEPRSNASEHDDRAERAENRREADRSEQNNSRADDTRDRTDEGTRGQDSDANRDEQETADSNVDGEGNVDGDAGTGSENATLAQQSDVQTDSSDATVNLFANTVDTVIETEAALLGEDAETQTAVLASPQETVDAPQTQTDPSLLGTAAGLAGPSVTAQAPAFIAASAGLTQRPGELSVPNAGSSPGQAAVPADPLISDPNLLADGEGALEGNASKQEAQGDRSFERTLAARNALASNENRSATGFQAAAALRGGDVTAADPATLPVGSTPQGQSGTASTVIRMVPIAASGQAATVPVHTMAFHIARNIDNGVNRFEIRVDPPELGKIDVTMELQSDGKVRVHMVVERGEALDFLQRDARALEKALSDAGLDTDAESVSFSLEQNDKGADGDRNDEFESGEQSGAGTDNDPADAPVSGSPRQYLSAAGVDIRI